ncbi:MULTISPECIES: SsrA-binding protein SmpB [Thalassobaculum]|uniref:SsrA-binding protein n=1 Tax=Thalassobaculum litoreum DSM 18839 TaxID=1123362 RepID=A0A8G2EU48_9PROT|nr:MULTISPECIES: SsrA-binding protein SmpB [Thalassobaculum]SDF15032.1 SsrA-binding protein [Thalassobaculum litoreum DSM 18839]
MAGKQGARKEVARNRRARHEYSIEDTLEVGLILTGSEVKSLRQGRASINEAYAGSEHGDLALINSHIPEYKPAEPFNHEPRRVRRLLAHRRERDRLLGLIRREGYTLVPLSLYFNDRGIAKLEIGLARGKKLVDKREDAKKRDWERQKARLLREKG